MLGFLNQKKPMESGRSINSRKQNKLHVEAVGTWLLVLDI